MLKNDKIFCCNLWLHYAVVAKKVFLSTISLSLFPSLGLPCKERERELHIDHLFIFVCCYETKSNSRQLNIINLMLHKLQSGS